MIKSWTLLSNIVSMIPSGSTIEDEVKNISQKWSSQRLNDPISFTLFYHTINKLGLDWSCFLVNFLTPLVIAIKPVERKASYQYWSIIRKNKKISIAYDIYKHFKTYGHMFIDKIICYGGGSDKFIIEGQGWEKVEQLVENGKMVIFVTFHLGNWELGGWLFQQKHYPLSIVMLPAESEYIQKLVQRWQGKNRPEIISLNGEATSSLQILKSLKHGRIVAIQGDRVINNNYAEIDFLGKKARFPLGPVSLGLITGAALVPAFAIKVDRNSYRFILHDPIFVESKDRKERHNIIKSHTEKIVKILEQYVREYPEQWTNFYQFWNTDEKN